MINLKHLCAVAIFAGAAAMFPASPAAAYGRCAAYGANVACVSVGHHIIDWCDREADGHRVFAQYYINRSTVVTTGVDANGSRRGCSHQNDVRGIINFRVCEIGSGCSAWKRA